MIGKPAASLTAVAALLAACSQASSPRVSEAAETQAILAPILPHGHNDRLCVQRGLRPALEEQRQQAADEIRSRSWKEWLEWLQSAVALTAKHNGRVQWTQLGLGPDLPLRQEDSDHLEKLLREALAARLPSGTERIDLPKDTSACTKADERAMDFDASHRARLTFSRPAVVGNVAFVETGAVCGLLCGSGHVVSLIKRNGQWSPLAARMTWIS